MIMKGYRKTSRILACIAVWLCLFAFVAAGCSARGGNSDDTADGQTETDSSLSEGQTVDSTYWENADLYTWRLEDDGKWELPENIRLIDTFFIGDKLFCSDGDLNMIEEGEEGGISVYSLTDKKTVEIEFSKIEKLINDELGSYSYMYIDKLYEGDDGRLYILAEAADVNNNYISFILKYNYEDETIEAMRLSADMPERNNPRQLNLAQDFVVTADGYYYVRDYQGLNIVDHDGNVTQLAGVNGRVFSYDSSAWYSAYYADDYGIFRIDEKGNVIERKFSFPLGDILGSVAGRIFVKGESGILVYDVEKETTDTLFRWTDVDTVSNDVTNVYLIDDSCIAVMYNDKSDETGTTYGYEFVGRVSRADITEEDREELVIGCMYTPVLLERNIVEFNKSQQKYHVSIRAYNDRSNELTTDEATTRLHLDLASGNAPDMLNLQYLDIYNLVDKGVIDDLRPYFDRDTEIDIQDYVESVVEAFTIDGVLTSVPPEYCIYSYFVNAGMADEGAGWTIEDVAECLNKNPDSVLSSYWPKEYGLKCILTYSVDAFIDEDNGTCDFTTETFDALLDIIGQLPDEGDYYLTADKTSLITDMALVGFERMQEIYAQYGDDIIIKGYVTADGRPCNSIQTSDAYSIVSTSDCKEGAWEFIKFSLTNNYSTDFSSNKQKLKEMIDEELAHAGEEKRSTFYTEQGPVNHHYATQEEIDVVMSLIDNVELYMPANSEIINIMLDEMESYFAGGKSKEATVAVIQDRVQLYLDERK
jgi:hypothetical protein